MGFELKTDFIDRGSQSEAIGRLSSNIANNKKFQVLLGVTGSGKTYSVARLIESAGMPVLVITHNKTLTAQLYSEFKSFFPENSVEYFVSYYDYYQPEAYIPQSDTYIDKDSSINDRIDRLRLKAAASLLSRKDVIIVASVSCIYGIGSPAQWRQSLIELKAGEIYPRQKFISDLILLQYERNDIEFTNKKFRVRGGTIDVFPAYNLDEALRVTFVGDKMGDRIASVGTINPVTGKKIKDFKKYTLYPATHFIARRETVEKAIPAIKKELSQRLKVLKDGDKYLEAQRLQMRTEYDIEMLKETGYCKGIENYSRHMSGRRPGRAPSCLIDYFPDKFLTIIDESHMTIPQIKGMYAGDRARKKTLIEHGFRLPSALDNRPLKLNEFENIVDYTVAVSATPADFEINKAGGALGGNLIEQVIRPTGLPDPEVEVRPVGNQVDDLHGEVIKRADAGERVLVTTLTKKMAEDLSAYFSEKGLRVRYLHSEIDTLQRINILRDLRKGEFDCLIGVNLLREGLDLPEVSLVAVLDADKEGFLRSETSLVQVSGRAARNVEGKVIMYADKITGSMERALGEMERRRKIQKAYNKKHNITPKSIVKSISDEEEFREEKKKESVKYIKELGWDYVDEKSKSNIIDKLTEEMKEAADMLDFELAAVIRDRISQSPLPEGRGLNREEQE
ncbi:MAG: excinuclease ABC subunit UvrB [Elusimicrobia bacterium]|nr:excinuclease ABC subunit UvrB [Elusimicrobiota bacterium]